MTKYNHTTASLKVQQWLNTAHFDKDITASLQLSGPTHNDGKKTVWFYPLVLFVSALVSCVPAHAVSRSAFQTLLTASPLLSEFRISNAELFTIMSTESMMDTIGMRLPTTNATPLQATSPYYQGIEKNATANATLKRNTFGLFRTVRTHKDGKSNFGLTIKSISYQGIEKNSKVRVFEHYKKGNAGFLHTLGATASVRVIRMVEKNTTANDRQLKNPLTDVKSWGYDGILSNITLAVKPGRKPLAFFVLKNWCDPQPSQSISTKQTILLQNSTSWHTCQQSMGWQTSQNKPVGEYAGSLLTLARVTPLHPMTFHSVVNTQTTLGGLYHA